MVLFVFVDCFGQNLNGVSERNLIIVTTDGLRWQEVFNGIDTLIMRNPEFSKNAKEVMELFWGETPEIRRSKLMPFFWSEIVSKGKIYGNRKFGNKVNVTNPTWDSYAGYNEIFTGSVDSTINNRTSYNPNKNVLEFVHSRPEFQNHVAAFSSWDKFPEILNQKRSGFPVVSGYADVEENSNGVPLSVEQILINRNQRFMIEERDVGTFSKAMEYMKVNRPKVLYIALNHTDKYGHDGVYDYYIKAAHNLDRILETLWTYIQSDSYYKDKTTLFITTDHGRGLGDEWKDHGLAQAVFNVAHSDEIWFAVMGPDITPEGMIRREEQLYQKQFAQTLANILGLEFQSDRSVGEAIRSVFE